MRLSREGQAHLAVAVGMYQRRAAEQGLAVPAELTALRVELSREAIQGQDGSLMDTRSGVAKPLPARSNHLLTIDEAAAELGCSRSTLKRRIKAGEIPVVRTGRLVRVRATALQTFIDRSEEKPAC